MLRTGVAEHAGAAEEFTPLFQKNSVSRPETSGEVKCPKGIPQFCRKTYFYGNRGTGVAERAG